MILKGWGENDFYPHFNVQVLKYYSVGVLIHYSAQGQKVITIYMNGVLSIFLQTLFLSYFIITLCHKWGFFLTRSSWVQGKIIHVVVCCFLNSRIDKVCFPTGSRSFVPSSPLSSCNTCGLSSPSISSVPTSGQSRSCLLSLPVPAVPSLALLAAWAANRTQGCSFPAVALLRSWAFLQR